MNLVQIVPGIILALLCIIPFVMMNNSTKKVKQKYLKLLNDLAQKSNTLVSEYDNWLNTAIGINEEKSELFFIKQTKENNNEQAIKINQITKTKISKITKTFDNNDKKMVIVEQVNLVISTKDLPEIVLPFYNHKTDSLSLSFELQLAEKWNKTINELIKQKK